MNAFPAGFTFNTLSAFPDTDDKPVPPLAIGNVPDVIAVPAFMFATWNGTSDYRQLCCCCIANVYGFSRCW